MALDATRGLAVMGILLMNIISFAMPSEAYVNPAAWAPNTSADLATWAVMAVLVDGKMRGLFSILFGASMLMVIDRADAKGENGLLVHRKRMFWLLIFGLIHAYFIWYGDILMTYALCGLITVALVHEAGSTLFKWAAALLGGSYLFWAILIGFSINEFPLVPDVKAVAREVSAYRGGYADILAFRFVGDHASLPFAIFASAALETIGLLFLGMALFKNGFLTGQWDANRYARLARWFYFIGIPPLVGVAAYAWANGFAVRTLLILDHAIVPPFRLAVTLGHAALAMVVIKRFADTPLMRHIVAAGRTAFTNYLGTSVLMTTLFYGYGAGLYGHLSRWQVYLVVPFVWIIMLAWSKPWLERFHYGPLEWLWRSLVRRELQAMIR
jgi:uncharacterized protein